MSKSNLRPRSASQKATTAEILAAIKLNDLLQAFFDDKKVWTRQREVGFLSLMGFTDDQMAAKLEIKKHTIRNHTGRLIKHLGLVDGDELLELLKTISYGSEES